MQGSNSLDPCANIPNQHTDGQSVDGNPDCWFFNKDGPQHLHIVALPRLVSLQRILQLDYLNILF